MSGIFIPVKQTCVFNIPLTPACEKLTSSSLEVWQRGHEDLMKEERTAVHLDGTGQQTAKVVDVPTEEKVRRQHERRNGR